MNSNWYKVVPKVELHLHLEGAIPHKALWELIQKYGGDSSIPDLNGLVRQFEYRDFSHFIEIWQWKNQFLREYADFTHIAEAVAQDLAEQNIRYAEVFYSPTDFSIHGLNTQQITMAIRRGFDRVEDINIMLIADLVRDNPPDKTLITLQEVNEVKNMGVIGIGLGGSEHKHPPELFKAVFEKARSFGFYTTAHAGESAGPKSIWGAIKTLKIDRIGHGIKAIEDERLLSYLAEHSIPLEICPISNICTGVVSSMDKHPICRFYERNISLTINTDDPKMFGTSLAYEYSQLVNKLGFRKDDIRRFILQGIQFSWADKVLKEKLIETFTSDPQWL